jgi:hypothetical protein
MWVYPCFEGDVDMARAWVQHDLYFTSPRRPSIDIFGGSTLGFIWANVILAANARRRSVPWLDRNWERLLKLERDGFSHKLLQVPHEHMAAYHRWIMPRVEREGVIYTSDDTYPMDLLEDWRAFLKADVFDLLSSSNRALVSLAKSMVYQSFDAGEEAYHDFQDILMRRYGLECVAKTWWAADVATRALPAGWSPSHTPLAAGGVHA